jgi:hypothetical protein
VWGHNSLAFVAGLTAHKEVALHEFRWLAGRWDPTVWNDHAEFLRVRTWVLTTAGPAATRTDAGATR